MLQYVQLTILYLHLLFHTCVQTYDVMGENFLWEELKRTSFMDMSWSYKSVNDKLRMWLVGCTTLIQICVMQPIGDW
jgi:hypothetical protein